MIKEKKINSDPRQKLPGLIKKLKNIDSIVAFYLHGSYVSNNILPLSDIDFAVLFNSLLTSKENFDLYLKVNSTITLELGTEEFDLINMNTYPSRFSHNVLKEGKLLFCNDREHLVDFIENNNIQYLDFKFYRASFDKVFLNSLGVYNE